MGLKNRGKGSSLRLALWLDFDRVNVCSGHCVSKQLERQVLKRDPGRRNDVGDGDGCLAQGPDQ
jgi:hypothetical protein